MSESILQQKNSNLKIIVINNGSTDCTLSAIEEFKRKNQGVIFINDRNEAFA